MVIMQKPKSNLNSMVQLVIEDSKKPQSNFSVKGLTLRVQTTVVLTYLTSNTDSQTAKQYSQHQVHYKIPTQHETSQLFKISIRHTHIYSDMPENYV